MKKFITLILLLSSLSLAQYNNERSTEQSFENSEMFFSSTYVNTYGINSFKNVFPGLLNDPFMDAYLNPANLPDLGDNDILVYLDFTGDREESEIINRYPYPYYYLSDRSYAPTLDPRWLNSSRREPSPVATLGLITYPLGKEIKNLVVGATYQLIYKEDRFYSVPYWIYNYSPYYDSFSNERALGAESSSIPIIDRYSGEDHMTTEGHSLTTFVSYAANDDLSFGLGFSGVWHSRNGSYLDQSQDEYGEFNRSEWSNKQSQNRDQDYSHIDVSLGAKYVLTPSASIGLKVGFLDGSANQTYSSSSEYNYSNDYEKELGNWYENMSVSGTTQSWERDGSTKYLGIYFDRKMSEETSLKFYYRYANTSLDITNSSFIADTSFYESSWYYEYNNYYSQYVSKSSTLDDRMGKGEKTKNKHEVGLNLKWELNEGIGFVAGFYYKRELTDIMTNEPVISNRYNYYDNDYDGHANTSTYRLNEDKWLEWNFNTKYWTVQIPIVLNIAASDNFEIMLGLNKKLETWWIKDETIAYFNYREENDSGVYNIEEDFGERYRQPLSNISETTTDVFAGVTVKISDKLKIRLLVDPEWDDAPKFSQWHLSFYGLL